MNDALSKIYQFVGDMVKLDGKGHVVGDYREHLEIAKLIVQRIVNFPDNWPTRSRKLLGLGAELAICVLAHDRGYPKPTAQPGLSHLLREISYEATDPIPPSGKLTDVDIQFQQNCLGVCRYAALTIESHDRLLQRLRGR